MQFPEVGGMTLISSDAARALLEARLRALYEISEELSRSIAREEIANAVTGQIVRVFGAAMAGLSAAKASPGDPAATNRLADAGLATRVEDNTTCCYAVQDKVWVTGPGSEPWEVYTVTGDARPDLNVHGEEREQTKEHPIPIPDKKKEVSSGKEVTTKNRNDKNSLEDYKDGKLD